MPQHHHNHRRLRIKEISPPLSSTLGNSTLRISGRGLDNVAAIMIDNAYVSSFRRINDEAITVILGPTSPGTHTLRVVSSRGSVGIAAASFTTVAPTPQTPVILSVTPLIDQYAKCDAPNDYRRRRVLVEGTNFTNVSAVYTDGVSRKFRILDSTQLEYEQTRQSQSQSQSHTASSNSKPSQRIAARDLVHDTAVGLDVVNTVIDAALIHASDIQLLTSDRQASTIFQFLALQPPRQPCRPHKPVIEDVVVSTVPIGSVRGRQEREMCLVAERERESIAEF